MAVLDFNTLLAINQMLAQNNVACTVHSSGGCTACGLVLEKKDETHSSEEIAAIINRFLKNKWLKVAVNAYDVNHLDVLDTF